MISTSQTLAERLAAGRIPVADWLRIAMLMAEQLRQLHDREKAHGALSPATIALSGNTVELLPAPQGAPAVTAYTAPEVLEGKPAESRSDIFSFGAIVYEMLTGRAAFEADSPQALATALVSGTPRPTGSPAVDRLVNGCLAKSPDGRFQRVQKLMLELRLLTSSARRGAPGASLPPRVPAYDAFAPAPAANSPVHELEARMAARMEQQERSVAGVAQIANEVLQVLRQQQSGNAPAPREFTRSFSAGPLDGSAAARLEHAVNLLSDKLSRMDIVVSSAVERLQKLEANLEAFDTDAAALRDGVTRDIRNFERLLKAQSTAIESARTAMGQTDDLVERVVEALDSLQTMFVSTAEEQSLAS